MKKFLASVAVVAALSTSAVAEESGYFGGLSWGYATGGSDISWLGLTNSDYKSATRFGLYGGYTQMFDNAFGARYYATLDFGGALTTGDKGTNGGQLALPWNLYVNADAIYNFNAGSSTEFGVFGGLGLGYTPFEMKSTRGDTSAGGFDLGLNLGLKVNYELFGSKLSTELYTRTGLYNSEKIGDDRINNSIIGLRTSYNF